MQNNMFSLPFHMHVNTGVLSEIHDPLHRLLYRNFTSRINQQSQFVVYYYISFFYLILLTHSEKKQCVKLSISTLYIQKEKSNLPYTSMQFSGKKYLLVYHIDWPQKELTKNKSPKRNVLKKGNKKTYFSLKCSYLYSGGKLL